MTQSTMTRDRSIEVTDLESLTGLLGQPSALERNKARSALTDVDIAWIEASPFCVVGTASASGHADGSPKDDPAGQLVHVIDDQTIAIAERPGSRRTDGHRNILENPSVALRFLIPGRGDTLRIKGHARLVSAAPFFDDPVVKGHRPLLVVVIGIDELEAYCGPSCADNLNRNPEA